MAEERKKIWNTYVNWGVFIPIAAFLLTIATMAINVAYAAKDVAIDVQSNVSTLDTDIRWIKETLTEVKSDIKDIKPVR